MKLTDKVADATKPENKDKFIRDTELRGFALKVTPTGRKAWVAEGRIKGSGTRRVTIGTYPTLTAIEARAKAREHLATMQSGKDPRVSVQEQKTANRTVGELFKEYIEVRGLKPSTQRDYRSVMGTVFVDWQKRKVKEITREDVQTKFIKSRKNRGERQAAKSFTILSAMFEYAKGDRIITENPCDILREKKLKAKPVRRTNYLTDTQVGQLFNLVSAPEKYLREQHGISLQGANFVRLLLLTGMRKSEAASLRWSDIDTSRNVIVLRDTKNGTEHYIPISGGSRWILDMQKKAAGDSPFVFPSRYDPNQHMTEPKSQLEAIRRMVGFQFTFHDLRRTFATHAEARGVPFESIQRALNHTTDSVTGGYIIKRIETLRPVFDKISEAYKEYYR